MQRPTQPARQPRFDAKQYEQLRAASGAHSRVSQANQAEADFLRVRQARLRLAVGPEPTKHPALASALSTTRQPDFPRIERVIELRRNRLGHVGAGSSLTKPDASDCLPTSSILATSARVAPTLQSAPIPSPEPAYFAFSGSVWNPVSQPAYATVATTPIARPGANDANVASSAWWRAKQAESRSALSRSRLKHYFKLWRELQLQRRAYQQLLAEQRRDRRLAAVAEGFQRKILLAEAWRIWTADLKVAGAQRNEAAVRIQARWRGELTRRRLPALRASTLAERRALLHHKHALVKRAFLILAQYMVRKRRWRRAMQSKYATWGPTMYLHTGKRFNPRWWFSREGKTVMSEEYYKWRLIVVAFTKMCLHTAKRGAEDVH